MTGSRTKSYSYDLNGNRTGTGYSTTIMNETSTSPGVTYTYDKTGNMISADSRGTFTTYAYDAAIRILLSLSQALSVPRLSSEAETEDRFVAVRLNV